MEHHEIDGDLTIDGFSVESIRILSTKDPKELSTVKRRSIASIFRDEKSSNNATLMNISNFFVESFKDEVIELPCQSRNSHKRRSNGSVTRKRRTRSLENTSNIKSVIKAIFA